MSLDSSQFISRSAAKFFSGTLLSRISGMVRDMMMAFYFGAAPALAAFFLAYRFVYLMRRLFGEGLLIQGFIPHFESARAKSQKEGALFFRDLFLSIVLILGGIVATAELVLFWCLHKGVFPPSAAEIIHLSMLILPGVFFICLFGLTSALLQSEKSFFLPSVSPAFCNLVWIIGVIALRGLPIEQAVIGLSLVLSFAFFLQWGATLPKVGRYLLAHLSFKEMFQGRIFSSKLKQLGKPLLLGMVGVAAVQVNTCIDALFARYVSLEGPAYLWYAIRMEQLPLALFGIALSSALFPSLTRAIELGDKGHFYSLLRWAEKRAFTLIFPCVIGIYVLGAASVNLLFGRGDFSEYTALQTTLCLWCYGLGLLPSVFVQIFAPAFYAKKNFHIPMWGAVSSSILNIGLNALLIFYFGLGAASIALATSFSALFNALFLFVALRKTEGREIMNFSPMMKMGLSALLAGGIVFAFEKAWAGAILFFPRGFSQQALLFFIPTGLYFLLLLSLCKIFKEEDIFQIFQSSK